MPELVAHLFQQMVANSAVQASAALIGGLLSGDGLKAGMSQARIQ